jgi:hypothetical protein
VANWGKNYLFPQIDAIKKQTFIAPCRASSAQHGATPLAEKSPLTSWPGIELGRIYRKHEGPKFFGLQSSQLEEKIRSGEIPAPVSLTKSGRAKGWFGWQIAEHHRQLVEREPPNLEAK